MLRLSAWPACAAGGNPAPPGVRPASPASHTTSLRLRPPQGRLQGLRHKHAGATDRLAMPAMIAEETDQVSDHSECCSYLFPQMRPAG